MALLPLLDRTKTPSRAALLLGLLALVLGLSGCASSAATEAPLEEPRYVQAQKPAMGSLYAANSSLSLFTDQRARQVGEILTVVLEESTSARKSATTNTSKNQSVGFEVPNFFGQIADPVQFGAEIGADRGFNGSGDAAQSNQLRGQVSVQIVERLPGGTFRIAGEKRIRLNQGVEMVRLSGLVRDIDIAPDNTVPSYRVAQADISYNGRGAVADANTQGWLARFFSSPLWPL